jgi:hypothetical protein
VDQIQSAGYFNAQDPGSIVIASSSDNDEESRKLADALKEAARQATQDAEVPVEVEAISVARERVLEAQKLGTTPGKLNLIQKLQVNTGGLESFNVQDWLKKPVKDIMKAIKAVRKDSNDTVSSQPEQSSSSQAASSALHEAPGTQKTSSRTSSKEETKSKTTIKSNQNSSSGTEVKSNQKNNTNTSNNTKKSSSQPVSSAPENGSGSDSDKRNHEPAEQKSESNLDPVDIQGNDISKQVNSTANEENGASKQENATAGQDDSGNPNNGNDGNKNGNKK